MVIFGHFFGSYTRPWRCGEVCGWFCTQRSDVVGTDQPYCSKDVEWRGEAGIGNDFLTSVPCERASERVAAIDP